MNIKSPAIQSFLPLNQQDFKAKIIQDTFVIEPQPHSKRNAIFECTKCGSHFEQYIPTAKINKNGLCPSCQDYATYKIKPVSQDRFKAKILCDIEYETKHRTDPKVVLLECKSCKDPFICDASEPHSMCETCDGDMISSPLPVIKDLGYIKTSKNKISRFCEFSCPDCGSSFVRELNHISHNRFNKCDRCLKPTTRTRIYWIWIKNKKNFTNNWTDFTNFKEWSLDNNYDDTKQLVKIAQNEPYSARNCLWVQIPQNQNQSPIKGVKKLKNGKWIAQIQVNNLRKHIGTYTTKWLAAIAYDNYIDENNINRYKNFNIQWRRKK